MVHRAIYGSIERFLGILIEHYGGAFPLWLSPAQIRVLTISEKQADGAREIIARLKKEGFRVEEDFNDSKIGYKIREAEMQKTPYIFVVGDKELQEKKVAVRKRGRQDLGAMDLETIMTQLKKEILEKI